MKYTKIFSLIIGPILFLIIKFIDIEGLSFEGQAILASTAWVAIWWITEAVELEVTALLPLLVFPLSNGMKLTETASSYGNSYLFLFMGGFIIGLAIEKSFLHKRIAYTIIRFIGSSPKKMILGFMAATAFLSMWISNTATAIMMLPIGISIIQSSNENKEFSKNLMLSIAYASSIGGMATLIGTPPNIIFAGIVKNSLGIEVSFGKWMIFAFPLSVLLLLSAWLYLTRNIHSNTEKLQLQVIGLGPMSKIEKRVAYVFLGVALLWITNSFFISRFIPQVDDSIIAIAGAFILFIIPSGKEKESLMDWETAKKLPWGVLLIFGAGLAIAKGFSETDLTAWIAKQFMSLNEVPVFLILMLVIAGMDFLTEITSNTALATIVLPLLLTLGGTLQIAPIPLLAGAVLASSCAFMLPVATPPNAIVFSSGKIKITDMVKSGFAMNVISIILIFLFVWFILPVIWH